jgi:integrase/recombinase XerD
MGIKRTIKKSAGSDVVMFKDAFIEFLEEKQARNLAEATLTSYEQTYYRFVNFFSMDEHTTTQEITEQLIFKWIGTLQLEGLSPTSINHYLREMRAFLYWCMDGARKYIEPAFKIQLIKGQEEVPKAFDEEDIVKLLEKPSKSDNFATWRTWAIVNWVLATGNRAATICDVQISDIDFKKKEIVLSHTKNKKAQIIPLSSSLEACIKEYIRVWRDDADEYSFLFCNVGEEQLTTGALKKAFTKYCERRGINQHNIHGLRHSFAKGWVKNNGNMFALQKVLGHSTLDMTRKYVKLYGEDLKEDYDKYSPLDSMRRSAKRTQTVKKSLLDR